MYQNVRGVALRTITYSDRSSILSVWTAELGRMSLLLNNSAGRESRRRRALTMPMSLFEGVVNVVPGREVCTVRDMKPAVVAPTVSGHPVKASVAMFMAEVLGLVLRDSGNHDEAAWAFLVDVVASLDAAGDSATVANFPLWFLYRLTVILGVEPDMSTYMRGRVLNLREGVFRQPLLVGGMRGEVTDSKGTFVTADASRMLSVLSRAGAGDLRRLRMTSVQRQRAIDVALDYLSAHLTALPRLKTLDVLRAVLR